MVLVVFLGAIGIVIFSWYYYWYYLRKKQGAALTMANSILHIVGKDKSALTMAATGYVTGIPVFCDSGFVIFITNLKSISCSK